MSKAGNAAGATKIIQDLAKSNKTWDKLTNTVRSWSPKFIQKIDNLPGGLLTRGMRNTIIDWIKLLSNANQGSRAASRLARQVSGKLAKGARLSPQQATDILKRMKELAKKDERLFSGLGGKPNWGLFSKDPKQYGKWSWESFKKYPFSGGIGRFWGNRQVRGLMRNTKWWLGFLDWVGLGNFVGPDELESQMGDYTNDLNQYSQTPEAQSYWNDDFGQTQSQTSTTSTPNTPPTPQNQSQDLLTQILFGGIPGVKPGVPGI